MKLSVVIPTHKRPKTLNMCLEYLAKQTVKDDLEVVVVSDGEGDKESEQVVHSSWPFKITYAEVPKSQQGVARNRGVELATGDNILFIGDDIFLAPDACEKHIVLHAQFESSDSPTIAVLGFTTWDPALEINSVMRWLESSGWQFGYGQLKRGIIATERQQFFTYTSHVSVPKKVAAKYPFRIDISLYGWEDIEWGKRLKDAGIPLLYEPDAKALHHHPTTLESSLRRMEILGQSAVMIERLNKELHLVPKGWKRAAYNVIALMPTMRGWHTKAFLQGLTK